MKSPICYPGAKIKLGSWIVEHLPEHRLYCEPFCGSAAAFFKKPPSDREVLNDRNSDITNFLLTVRDHPVELREFLENTPYSRAYFEELKQKWFCQEERPESPVRRAGEYFALMEQGYTADLEPGGFSRTSPHTNTGKVETFRNKIDERIEAAAERLHGVCIESLDYRECIDTYDYEDAVLYCDPPYFQRSTDYNAGDFSHEEFADSVRGVNARVVVSYDDLPPSFVELVKYEGWFVAERDATRTVVNYQSTDEAKERLLLNFDPHDALDTPQSMLEATASD